MEIAVMDKKGIIESFADIETAINSIDRIRAENEDIEGDLLVVEIHYRAN